MIAVLVCALMVSSLLVTVTRAQDDSLAGLQQQSLGEYQQEEAQEIQFNMQMQKLQAEADKASGAQIGGGRRLVQDLTALYQQDEAEDIELNQQMQKQQAEGYGEDASIGSRRRLVQDLTALYQQDEAENIELNQQMQKQQAEGYGEDASIGSRRRLVQDLWYISKTSIWMRACMHARTAMQLPTLSVYTRVMSDGVSVSTNIMFVLKFADD